jgi:coproporphyrinogen III oxidase
MSVTKESIEKKFIEIQAHICQAIENADGKARFQSDVWKREEGGGGKTNILQDGNVIAKGGVNFSAVWGKTPSNILNALKLPESDFYATGVSIVMHTQNPWVPIIHMNIRYFEMSNGTWWFGGGIDLTPHYILPEQATLFHQHVKNICDKHDTSLYSQYKEWADTYFYIKHRKETRGIGGIFFDRINTQTKLSKEQLFDFVCDIGYGFAEIYPQLMSLNKDTAFSERELEWQRLRRGRYVEFNLVYDKGTKFGLDTDGRIESILMSLPPLASWTYDYQPEANSKEEQTLNWLKNNPNWLA